MNAFKTVHDRLAALTNKRLARMSLWDKDLKCGCAIGSIMPARVRRGRSAVIADDNSALRDFSWSTERIGQSLAGMGLTPKIAYEIQRVNDCFQYADETPEERYTRVLDYLKEKIG